MRVHHKNLTSLVGYCDEDQHKVIIIEYMANRSLDEYLSGNSSCISSWVKRLEIALDAAEGLEYLHHGCNPPIIHRDVKTGNILLDEQFHAKLADFGLSEAYPAKGGTHISTFGWSGTPGYVDPEYKKSSRLTKESDVFSFGVVLLKMITGQQTYVDPEGKTHISQWVEDNVQKGYLTTQFVDARFEEKFDVTSVREAVKLALTCVSEISSGRPTMNTVVKNLEECLAIERIIR